VHPAAHDETPPPLNYCREERAAPIGDIRIERFADGGVTVRAPTKTRETDPRFGFWCGVVGFLLLMALVAWRQPHGFAAWVMRGPYALLVIAGVALALAFRRAYLAPRRRRVADVVGISPSTVYVDVPPYPPYEVPRSALRHVLMLSRAGEGKWSHGVQLVIDDHVPVLFCDGRREREISDVVEALQQAVAETALAGFPHKGSTPPRG
jgi:hypothetical protein